MAEATFLGVAFAAIAVLDARRARWGGALLGAAWWIRPEAAVLAPLAVLAAPLGRRARVVALATALAVALPYTVLLRIEQGYWSLSPKTALVHAPPVSPRAAEWRLHAPSALPEPRRPPARLARRAASDR